MKLLHVQVHTILPVIIFHELNISKDVTSKEISPAIEVIESSLVLCWRKSATSDVELRTRSINFWTMLEKLFLLKYNFFSFKNVF